MVVVSTHANRQPMHPCGPPAVKSESAARQKREIKRQSMRRYVSCLQKFNLHWP